MIIHVPKAEELVRELLVENFPDLHKDNDADDEGDSSDKYCSHCAGYSIFHVFGMSACYVDHNAQADAETDVLIVILTLRTHNSKSKLDIH